MQGIAVPVSVTASASNGVAVSKCGCSEGTEDTITLMVKWRNIENASEAVAVYTGIFTCQLHESYIIAFLNNTRTYS